MFPIGLPGEARDHPLRLIAWYGRYAAELGRRKLKAAAALGFLMSVVGAFFTVFPIIDVQSRFLFAAKIIGVVIVANAIGAAIYTLDKKRSR